MCINNVGTAGSLGSGSNFMIASINFPQIGFSGFYPPISERMPHVELDAGTIAAHSPERRHLGFVRRPVGTDRVNARVARA